MLGIHERIFESQLIRFLTILCNNMEDFHEATSILYNVLHDIIQEDFLGEIEILEKLSVASQYSGSHWSCIKMQI